MTVYILHTAPDLPAAQGLETFLERRGHFSELQDGEMALRPVGPADVVIALVSKDFVFSPWRLRLEQRALEAWAENRLVVVKLDHNFAPVGLRDLPFVDASFEVQRDPFTWLKVEQEIRDKLRPPAPGAAPEQSQQDSAVGGPPPVLAERPAPAPQRVERRRASAPAKTRVNVWGVFLGVIIIAAGAGAAWVTAAIWLVNRIGPRPGTLGDLIAGLNDFGARHGAPAWFTAPLFVVLIAAAAATLVVMVTLLLAKPPRRRIEDGEDYEAPPIPSFPKSAAKSSAPSAPPATSGATFVSYARANSDVVMPVIDGAKAQGGAFWLDTENMDAGESWAGEIVRAIKAAQGVLVMCSNAAFESDHVKREIYLADRYKKRMLPVFIEDVAPPEDFEYFFAGVQWLKLHQTPEPERAEALVRALAGANT